MLRRTLQIVTGVLLGLAFVTVLFSTGLVGPEREPVLPPHEIVSVPFEAPPLVLPDIRGRTFDLAEHWNEVSLVFFGFANCPDVCPATLAYWSQALDDLEADGLAFNGVFVSVDPTRDTPDALDRWMEHFHPSIVALTGTDEDLKRTTEDWNIYVSVHDPERQRSDAPDPHAGHPMPDPHAGHAMPDPLDSNSESAGPGSMGVAGSGAPDEPGMGSEAPGYLVDHSSRTFVVDRDGQVVRTLLPYVDGPSIAEILRPILTR